MNTTILGLQLRQFLDKRRVGVVLRVRLTEPKIPTQTVDVWQPAMIAAVHRNVVVMVQLIFAPAEHRKNVVVLVLDVVFL